MENESGTFMQWWQRHIPVPFFIICLINPEQLKLLTYDFFILIL